MEIHILDMIQNLRTPIGDVVVPLITRLGNAGIIWIILTVLLLIIPKTRKTGVIMMAALLVDVLLCNVFIKNLVARTRPFDVNTAVQLLVAKPRDYSFPSGHTATAFMAATMFHKEYGIRSPWYSVAGYTIATATAYSRLLNNRHWISDVLAGAGIGIISTELGYWITGLIFKDKGIQWKEYDYDLRFPDRTPSFLGLYTGYMFMSREIRLSDELVFHTSAGASSGIEGAWFINNYVGIGGQVIASHVPAQLQMNDSFASYLPGRKTAVVEDGIDFVSASVGAYFDCALTYRWSIGSKLLAGYSFSDAQTLYLSEDEGETTIPFLKLKEMHAPDFQTGLNISYWAKLKMGFRFFFDYTLTPARYRYYFADKPNVITSVNKNLSSFTLGASVNILL